jgi:hypothetical protein
LRAAAFFSLRKLTGVLVMNLVRFNYKVSFCSVLRAGTNRPREEDHARDEDAWDEGGG